MSLSSVTAFLLLSGATPPTVDVPAETQTQTERQGNKGAQTPLEPPVVVPLQMRFGDSMLSLISATTVFGTPVDVTLSELALETFFPADQATAEALRAIAGS